MQDFGVYHLSYSFELLIIWPIDLLRELWHFLIGVPRQRLNLCLLVMKLQGSLLSDDHYVNKSLNYIMWKKEMFPRIEVHIHLEFHEKFIRVWLSTIFFHDQVYEGKQLLDLLCLLSCVFGFVIKKNYTSFTHFKNFLHQYCQKNRKL